MDSSTIWYFFLDSEVPLLWECQGLFLEITSSFCLSGCCKAYTLQRWCFISQIALNRSPLVLTFVAFSM